MILNTSELMSVADRRKEFLKLPILNHFKLSDHKYYVFSYESNILDKENIETYNQGLDWKPQGLWYAKGSKWLEFLYDEYVEFGEDWAFERAAIYQKVYEIKINYEKVKKITLKKDIIEFTKTYGTRIPSKHMVKYNYLIDWTRVAEGCHGVEFPYKEWAYEFLWLRDWGGPAITYVGCVLDKESVESINLVYETSPTNQLKIWTE